jgi:3-deoxy-D-arabino-heptulosonate 7-phosphate (DAHP) synthase
MTMAKQPRAVQVGPIGIAQDRPLTLIAGPCVIESREHALMMAAALVEMTGELPTAPAPRARAASGSGRGWRSWPR